MNKTIEPKENEIKCLKDELFNLEAQFEKLIKSSKENISKMYIIIYFSLQLNDQQVT